MRYEPHWNEAYTRVSWEAIEEPVKVEVKQGEKSKPNRKDARRRMRATVRKARRDAQREDRALRESAWANDARAVICSL